MRKILLVLLLVQACWMQVIPSKYMSFDEFRAKFHKKYQPGSVEYEEKKKIYQFNIQVLMTNNCTVCGVTKFFDIDPSEFQKKILNLEEPTKKVSSELPQGKVSAPSTLDWRKSGIITSVKDQGDCGCCWSFATVAMSESSLILRGEASKSIDLSEQFLLRCTKDSDCQGGYIENAMDRIIASGAPSESKYPYSPYTYNSGICSNTLLNTKVSRKRRQSYYGLTSEQVKTLLVSGPLAIAVSAENWQFYLGGVWRCSPRDPINHAVLLVGWEEDAWIIKNQWGEDWGQNGYIRVSMNSNYNCHVGQAVHRLSETAITTGFILCLFVILQLII